MRSLVASGGPSASAAHDAASGAGPDTGPGRWIWGLTGLITVIGLAVPGTWLIANAGNPRNGQNGMFSAIPTRTVIITQPVTSLSVESYGAPIQVAARPVHRVTVIEAINYGKGGQGNAAPTVTDTVSHGRLTLAAPACANSDCSVGFTVTMPEGVAVTAASDGAQLTVAGAAGANLDSGGGPVQATQINGPLTITAEGGGVTVSGAAAANLDSGGGPVIATGIDGPLTITAEGGGITVSGAPGASLDSGGGPVQATRIDGPLMINADGGGVTVNDLVGDLTADTGGGPLTARSVTAGKATVTTDGGGVDLTFSTAPTYVLANTGGGPATLTFADPPRTVSVFTDGGGANLVLPGGPYALTVNSDGGGMAVQVPTSPNAGHLVTVNTGGGPLTIEPVPVSGQPLTASERRGKLIRNGYPKRLPAIFSKSALGKYPRT
jgi:hypothetical protein